MSNTDINGLRVPDLTDSADITDAVGNLADDVDTRLFARFATPSARDSAITSPVPGMVCFVESFNLPMIYYTAYWGFFPGTPLATLYQTVSQSIANNSPTEYIIFDSEEFDRISAHESVTHPSRYTPSIPGYYKFEGGVTFPTPAGTYFISSRFEKNPATLLLGPEGTYVASTVGHSCVSTQSIVALNGTTDFVSLAAFQNSGAAVSTLVTTKQFYPTMHVTYMGSA